MRNWPDFPTRALWSKQNGVSAGKAHVLRPTFPSRHPPFFWIWATSLLISFQVQLHTSEAFIHGYSSLSMSKSQYRNLWEAEENSKGPMRESKIHEYFAVKVAPIEVCRCKRKNTKGWQQFPLLAVRFYVPDTHNCFASFNAYSASLRLTRTCVCAFGGNELEVYWTFYPFTPRSDQSPISPATRNITPQSMVNLAFHSLLRWKMIITPILATSLIHLSLGRLERIMYFLNLGVKG